MEVYENTLNLAMQIQVLSMNKYLIEYAINSILRQKSKNIFIFIVFTLLIFLLTSIFFITNSIKYELNSTVNSLPQIIVQNYKGGRHYDIEISKVDKILSISGVQESVARVWGYYYFENADVHFTLVGIDMFENQYKKSLTHLTQISSFDENSMYLGRGVKKLMYKNYYKNYFNFIKPNGTVKKIDIAGVFNSDIELESNDMIVMSKENLREIFALKENMATDIVVKVSNPNEIDTIALKIKEIIPTARVITNEDIKVSYEHLFNYKSGIFLALFIISLFTFFIIIYDKASGLSSEEKHEVGILKAIGWRVEDILQEKFYESFIISFFSYLLGVIFAFAFVYLFEAPLIRDIFIGYSNLKPSFSLSFIMDFQTLFLVFLLSVPIYIASIIIPSWRVATLDADEVIR